jgi:5-(carboxyamino)imidazole ribonucleotide synthase
MNSVVFIGAGQLALMMLPHANRLGFRTLTFDTETASAHTLSHQQIYGNINEAKDFQKLLGLGIDFAILDIEHVSLEGLELLEKNGIKVGPTSKILALIKDKAKQREFVTGLRLKSPWFKITEKGIPSDLPRDKKYVLKLRSGGYDGKGVCVLGSMNEVPETFLNNGLLIEERIDIAKELSLIIARNAQGEIATYEPIEMLVDPKLHLLDTLFSPAIISESQKNEMITHAKKIVDTLKYEGLLAIEFFLTKQGELIVNEMAPRPHNSGHHTQISAPTDQFEQHIRAVLGLPLGDTTNFCYAMTVNIVSDQNIEGLPRINDLPSLLKNNAFVQWYGKNQARAGRKMGHVNLATHLNKKSEQALTELTELKERIKPWTKIVPQ